MATGLNVDKKDILDICARIEDTAARTYHLLANAHRDIPRLALLWVKTAHEEENHARQFRMNPRLIDQMVSDLRIDVDQAQQALEEMKVLEDLAATTPPGPVDALLMAIVAEGRFAEFHMSAAAVFNDGSHKRLFQSMMAADRGHIDELSHELKRLSGG